MSLTLILEGVSSCSYDDLHGPRRRDIVPPSLHLICTQRHCELLLTHSAIDGQWGRTHSDAIKLVPPECVLITACNIKTNEFHWQAKSLALLCYSWRYRVNMSRNDRGRFRAADVSTSQGVNHEFSFEPCFDFYFLPLRPDAGLIHVLGKYLWATETCMWCLPREKGNPSSAAVSLGQNSFGCWPRQVRCNQESPTCHNCRTWNVRCTYSEKKKRAGQSTVVSVGISSPDKLYGISFDSNNRM